MQYISTRGGIEPISFSEAVMMGLAQDGGLLLPQSLPNVDEEIIARWQKMNYQELAIEVMSLFISDLSKETLKDLIWKSYKSFKQKEITPIVKAGDFYILELFHGPTLAFKDIALQFLGNLFSLLLKSEGSYMNIIGATSGDTGSAAIHGVKGKENINIFILHPHGRVSRMQALQMTTVQDENCFNLAIEGTFDDCQAIVKTIFNDLDFKKKYRLGAINSINWARVLAQVVYYVYAALKFTATGEKQVIFSVPTGNFGDIFAGFMAQKLLPGKIARLILATNENDILTRFINQGLYKKGKVVQTISPSMDIQIASNFERYLYYLYGEDPGRVQNAIKKFERTGVIQFDETEMKQARRDFASYSIDQHRTREVIRQVYDICGYVCDPHTAVGIGAAMEFVRNEKGNIPIICLATAHPCKFPEAVKEAIGKAPQVPDSMKALERLPQRYEVLPASVDRVKEYVRTHAIT